MQVKQIEFQFKGTRNYIQGPDIFNAMLSALECPVCTLSNIHFTAHHFLHDSFGLLHTTGNKEDLADLQNIAARCQVEHNDLTLWLSLTPLPKDNIVPKRCEYAEEKVVSLCQICEKKITLMSKSPFTFIESIVSMNKYLHHQLFPEIQGKWIFVGIDLVTGCDKYENLAVELKHNMNYRLTKSDVIVDGKKLGNILFSLVKA